MTRVYCTKDDSGHWYVIPYELKDDFNLLITDMDNEPFNYDLFQEFEDKYGYYRTGGDLNLISLYANFDEL